MDLLPKLLILWDTEVLNEEIVIGDNYIDIDGLLYVLRKMKKKSIYLTWLWKISLTKWILNLINASDLHVDNLCVF